MSIPKHYIFDLGKVILNYDNALKHRYLAERTSNSEEEIEEILYGSTHYHQYERGKISEEEYLEYFNSKAKQEVSMDDFLHGINCVFLDMRKNIPETLSQLKSKGHKLYALTNTIAPHVPIWKDKFKDAVDQMDHLFISNEMGMRKPDLEIYQAVISHIDDEPSKMLFFDDRFENVEAAQEVGIQARLVEDEDSVELALKELDII